MDKNEKLKLEDTLEAKGFDYDYVTDFAHTNNLYYESALLVLAGKKTLAEAKSHDDEKTRRLNESYISNNNDDIDIEEALAECVRIAKAHKNN